MEQYVIFEIGVFLTLFPLLLISIPYLRKLTLPLQGIGVTLMLLEMAWYNYG